MTWSVVRGSGDTISRAWIWAIVRLIPQDVPRAPHCVTNSSLLTASCAVSSIVPRASYPSDHDFNRYPYRVPCLLPRPSYHRFRSLSTVFSENIEKNEQLPFRRDHLRDWLLHGDHRPARWLLQLEAQRPAQPCQLRHSHPGGQRCLHREGHDDVRDARGHNLVSAQDFTLLKSTFGKQPTDPGYDPRADFNGDNVVTSPGF